MKEQLKDFLRLEGYMALGSNLPEFMVFLKKEYRHTEVIFVIELEDNTTCTQERYKSVWDSAYRLLQEKGLVEMHILTIVIAGNLEHAFDMCSNDKYAWIICRNPNRLVIEENKVADFYGLKNKLEVFLKSPEAATQTILDIEKGIEKELQRRKRLAIKTIYVPWVAYILCAINIVVWIVCTDTGNLLYNMGELSLSAVSENNQWYRLITCMFLHGNFMHLCSNMLILYLLGNLLEKRLGHWAFLIYYLTGGIFASCISLITKYNMSLEVPSIGASGAIYTLFVMAWILEFTQVNWKNLRGATVMRLLVIVLLVIINIYTDMQMGNVDYYAHLGGMFAGLIFGISHCIFTWKRKKEMGNEG